MTPALAARHASLAAVLGLILTSPAAAQYYIGPSYLKVPGAEGGRNAPAPYRGWVRAEANYWTERPKRTDFRMDKEATLKFTGSQAPLKGPDVLSLAIDKASPGLPAVMRACHEAGLLPEVAYAESAELMRHPQETGPRPADIPAFYEYRLRNVTLSCPEVAGAPEQALQLHFQGIDWLNTRPEPQPRALSQPPARLAPAKQSGGRKVFVVHWLSLLADSGPGQCAQMNLKPTEADYYALMPADKAAQKRAEFAPQGGVGPKELAYRGPNQINVTLLPGVVKNPGFVEPTTQVVEGFDLDGDDGSGSPPPGVRKHRNYVSPDGRRGIDNQVFTVQGCVAGLLRNGVRPMLTNESRRSNGLAMLIEISGIDDPRNDDDVAVTILYSTDTMLRDGRSRGVLPDYTFRVNESPEFSKDFVRFKGRIIDGVVMTEPLKKITLRQSAVWAIATIYNAQMRIETRPDGAMHAIVGGYVDWRRYAYDTFWNGSTYETIVGFSAPGLYNALRRAADGLKDPVTGEFDGISTVFEIEGVPAFIPAAQDRALLAGKIANPKSGRGDLHASLSQSTMGRP